MRSTWCKAMAPTILAAGLLAVPASEGIICIATAPSSDSWVSFLLPDGTLSRLHYIHEVIIVAGLKIKFLALRYRALIDSQIL